MALDQKRSQLPRLHVGSPWPALFLSLAALCAAVVLWVAAQMTPISAISAADHHLVNLFRLYRATSWQTLRYLRLPAAMPFFLGGLRISVA